MVRLAQPTSRTRNVIVMLGPQADTSRPTSIQSRGAPNFPAGCIATTGSTTDQPLQKKPISRLGRNNLLRTHIWSPTSDRTRHARKARSQPLRVTIAATGCDVNAYGSRARSHGPTRTMTLRLHDVALTPGSTERQGPGLRPGAAPEGGGDKGSSRSRQTSWDQFVPEWVRRGRNRFVSYFE